jgi:hypothetical protein
MVEMPRPASMVDARGEARGEARVVRRDDLLLFDFSLAEGEGICRGE